MAGNTRKKTVRCGRQLPSGGRCNRPVAAPGAPCGIAHRVNDGSEEAAATSVVVRLREWIARFRNTDPFEAGDDWLAQYEPDDPTRRPRRGERTRRPEPGDRNPQADAFAMITTSMMTGDPAEREQIADTYLGPYQSDSPDRPDRPDVRHPRDPR